MNKVSLPVAHYRAMLKRPELDFQKMKEKLGQILEKNRTFFKSQNSKPLAVSMEQTAKQILLLFLRKFSKGEIKGGTKVKFTYSYLAKSLGAGYRVPAEKTVYRHILRFLELPFKFLTQKNRSSLSDIGLSTNCIEIELHPSLVCFKSEAHQKAHEQAETLIGAEVKKFKPLKQDSRVAKTPDNLIPFPSRVRAENRTTSDGLSLGNLFATMSAGFQ